MRLDLGSEPEWRSYIPRLNRDDAWDDTPIAEFPDDTIEQKAWIRGQLEEFKCPFAWLLNNTVNPVYDV